MKRNTFMSLAVLAVFTFLSAPQKAAASSTDTVEEMGQINTLTPKPIARARGEVQVRRLRLLIAEKRIDADNLIKALQALRDDQ